MAEKGTKGKKRKRGDGLELNRQKAAARAAALAAGTTPVKRKKDGLELIRRSRRQR